MNELFVNIKVDREERPDIDQIYMNALHLLGEQGGWPLTMFLTPSAEPVWGGTYFPKESRLVGGDPDPNGHCPPQYPQGVVAGAGDRQAVVQWSAARSATSYTVTASPGGQSATVDGSLTQATIGGLTDETSYTFTVVTNLGAESGIPSQPSAPVTPQLVSSTIAVGFVTSRSTATTIATGSVPSPASPITTAITYPANPHSHADLSQPLSIVQSALASPAPTGYQFFGQEIDITAPLGDPFTPITLVFNIDNSLLGDNGSRRCPRLP